MRGRRGVGLSSSKRNHHESIESMHSNASIVLRRQEKVSNEREAFEIFWTSLRSFKLYGFRLRTARYAKQSKSGLGTGRETEVKGQSEIIAKSNASFAQRKFFSGLTNGEWAEVVSGGRSRQVQERGRG